MRRHAQAPWTVGARRRAHLSVAQIPLRDAGPAGSAAGARHRGECEGSEARRHLRPDFSAPRSSGMATSAPARTAVPSSSVIAITRRRKAGRNYSHEPRYRRSTRGSRYTRTTKYCLTEQDLSSTRRVAVITDHGGGDSEHTKPSQLRKSPHHAHYLSSSNSNSSSSSSASSSMSSPWDNLPKSFVLEVRSLGLNAGASGGGVGTGSSAAFGGVILATAESASAMDALASCFAIASTSTLSASFDETAARHTRSGLQRAADAELCCRVGCLGRVDRVGCVGRRRHARARRTSTCMAARESLSAAHVTARAPARL